MKFSKVIVTLIILMNIVFAGAVLYIFAESGYEPSALIGAWFAFTTGELWALSKIKRAEADKVGKERKVEEIEYTGHKSRES